MTLALVGVAGEAARVAARAVAAQDRPRLPAPVQAAARLDDARRRAGSAAASWPSSTSRCVAVAVIAVAGAISSYLNTVAHHQRRAMGHARPAADAVSPHSSPVARRTRREDEPAISIGRVTSDIESIQDFVTIGAPGHRHQRPDPGRHRRRDAVPELAVHADLARDRAGALPGRVRLHAAHQEGLARRQEEGERAGLDRRGGLLVDSRGQGLCARGLRGAAIRAPEPGERRDGAAWRATSR